MFQYLSITFIILVYYLLRLNCRMDTVKGGFTVISISAAAFRCQP